MCSENLILVSNQGWMFFLLILCSLACALLDGACSWFPKVHTPLPSPCSHSRLFWCIISIIQHNWLFIISTSPFCGFPCCSLFLSAWKPSLSPFLFTSLWGEETQQANISLGLSIIPAWSFIYLKGQSKISLDENEEEQVYSTFWFYR